MGNRSVDRLLAIGAVEPIQPDRAPDAPLPRKRGEVNPARLPKGTRPKVKAWRIVSALREEGR